MDEVGTNVSRQAGYMIPVFISRELSDRIEVPEEWQEEESFDGRLLGLLTTASQAISAAPAGTNPVAFEVVVPSNLTHQPEVLRLQATFDGDSIGIAEAD